MSKLLVGLIALTGNSQGAYIVELLVELVDVVGFVGRIDGWNGARA